jgi:hypothetical protein
MSTAGSRTDASTGALEREPVACVCEQRGAVAFLLFLPPKPSAKPNSVRQMDPRSFHCQAIVRERERLIHVQCKNVVENLYESAAPSVVRILLPISDLCFGRSPRLSRLG